MQHTSYKPVLVFIGRHSNRVSAALAIVVIGTLLLLTGVQMHRSTIPSGHTDRYESRP